MGNRKVADCRDTPSVMNCSLTIAGTEDEVMEASIHHVTTVHGHEDTPELREEIRNSLKDEE